MLAVEVPTRKDRALSQQINGDGGLDCAENSTAVGHRENIHKSRVKIRGGERDAFVRGSQPSGWPHSWQR
jgi:hypothetical protein